MRSRSSRSANSRLVRATISESASGLRGRGSLWSRLSRGYGGGRAVLAVVLIFATFGLDNLEVDASVVARA